LSKETKKPLTGFLDIYVKLIIAIISFIAPIIVYLLSVYSDGIAIIRRRVREEENQIAQLTKTQISENVEDFRVIIAESTKDLQNLEKRNRHRLNLLTPEDS
jgi:hypothetical protein